MKTNIFFTIAAVSAMSFVACNKLDTPTYDPFVYTVENAKINLGGTNHMKGPVACIELNADGTYIAEVPADGYTGIDKYLQIPFERIIVGLKDSAPVSYIIGNYNAGSDAYDFTNIGTLSFEKDMFYANYTYNGTSYRERTGITPAERLPKFTSVAGNWTPSAVQVEVNNVSTGNTFAMVYDGLNLETIASDVAATCAPRLTEYIGEFKGYNLTKLYVSNLNTFIFSYANGATIGGYWKFDNAKSGSVSKTLNDGRKMDVSASFVPSSNNDVPSIQVNATVKIDGTIAYEITISLKMK